WRTNAQLELATVNDVGWFNHHRLHASIGNRPPVEHDCECWPRVALGFEPGPAQAALTVTELPGFDGDRIARIPTSGKEDRSHGKTIEVSAGVDGPGCAPRAGVGPSGSA